MQKRASPISNYAWPGMWWLRWISGISANPAIGYTSDLLVAAGGSVFYPSFGTMRR